MKNCAIACAALFFLSFQASAQTYLSEDFNNGIPHGFILVDNDGLSPSADATKVGFQTGTPWITLTPKGESNPVAASTSWYSPAGQSDDWLITPPVTLDKANVWLSWKAKAAHKKYNDGYAVYVSVGGGTDIADFDVQDPLFATDAEQNAWVSHSVDLSPFLGQTIRIAFVSNSYDKQYLYLDDIIIAAKSDIILKSDMPKATPYVGDVEVSGSVYSNSDKTFDGFTVGLEYDGNTFTQHFDQQVVPGQDVPFVLDTPITIADRETVQYKLYVNTDDGDYFELPSELTAYQRKVVGEEVTGTWCSWCVRGIVMLDSLKRTAHDWFIGMAVHSDDVMANDYTTGLASIFSWSGLPNGLISRARKADPGEFVSIGTSVLKSEEKLVSVLFDASVDKDTKTVTTTTNLRFQADEHDANYKLAYAVIENNVHHPDDDNYYQNNAAYSGGSAGEMGGWENKPGTIPASEMVFQEVARGYSGPFTGIPDVLPTTIAASQDITYDYAFQLPDGIDNIDQCEVIVMLVDGNDDHIVNAEICPLSGTDAVTSLSDNNRGSAVVGFFSADGKRIGAPQHGLNIIRYANGTSRKIFVR